jgi:alcohol dehydrogenase
MKAAQISQFGDASVITVANIDKPSTTDDQILVKVAAASINPFDSAVRNGMIASLADNLPFTLGLDFAGTVAEIGANVAGFAVGDRVFGSANVLGGGSGAFAEYAAVNPTRIAKTPASISDQEAAALPTAGVSATQEIIDNLQVKPGQKVFINGGSGGVGSYAIQIAKALGAYVATTASTNNVEFVKSLGADEVIDYKITDFTTVISGYDAASNNVYSDKVNDILKVVKDGGKAVSIAGSFDEAAATAKNITAINQGTDVATKSLDELAGMVDDGDVKVIIAKQYPLDKIQDAYTDKENGSIQGKIVITIA